MEISISGFPKLNERTQIALLAAFACVGILYLVPKVLPILHLEPQDHFDFQHTWLAGKFWVSGLNPYDGPRFQRAYLDTFNLVEGPAAGLQVLWLYPPYWFPLAAPLGLLPFPVAISIWKAINFSLLIGATHLVARAAVDTVQQKYLPVFFTGIGFVCFMQATAVSIWGGQSTILVYFGLSAIIFGLLKARTFSLIVGLIFVALKPQIGVVAFAAVAGLNRYRWTILPPALICFLASAPIALAGGYRASIEGFLANLARQPYTMSYVSSDINGIIRVLDLLSSFSVSTNSLIAVLTAVICSFALFLRSTCFGKRDLVDGRQRIASVALFIAITFFCVPLHDYDFVSLAILSMLIVAMPLAGRWVTAIGLLISARPGNLLTVFSSINATVLAIPESHLITLALFLLLVGALWVYCVPWSSSTSGRVTKREPA